MNKNGFVTNFSVRLYLFYPYTVEYDFKTTISNIYTRYIDIKRIYKVNLKIAMLEVLTSTFVERYHFLYYAENHYKQ